MTVLFALRLGAIFFAAQAQLVEAAVRPALKRQFDTIQDLCGVDAVDCGNGWCCMGGLECVAASPEPFCLDETFTDIGVPGFTIPAQPYSSLFSDLASLNSELSSLADDATSLGLTLGTSFASTALTGIITELPTYTDNVLPTTYSDVSRSSRPTPQAEPSSTGAAVGMKHVDARLVVGGVVGLGFGVMAGM